MTGFNFPTQFPPELLAQIAAASFKPPQAMNVPGLNVPTGPPPAPGLNVGDGMAALGAGLGALKGMMGGDAFMAKERTAGDADLGGYGASPVDPMSGNPNAQPVEVFNPTGAVKGGGAPDFLTGIWQKPFG